MERQLPNDLPRVKPCGMRASKVGNDGNEGGGPALGSYLPISSHQEQFPLPSAVWHTNKKHNIVLTLQNLKHNI